MSRWKSSVRTSLAKCCRGLLKHDTHLVEEAAGELLHLGKQYLRRYRRGFSRWDFEVVSAQALETLFAVDRLLSRSLDNLTRLYQRLLERQRAQRCRQKSARSYLPFEPALHGVLAPSIDDEQPTRDELDRSAAKLTSFFRLAFDSLLPRDRALLVAEYHLEEFQIKAPGVSLGHLKEGARRTALCRARMRFRQSLRDILLDAGLNQILPDPEVGRSLIDFIDGREGDSLTLFCQLLHLTEPPN